MPPPMFGGPVRRNVEPSGVIERGARSAFRAIGPGTWKAVDEMEDDGAGNGPFRIRLAVTLTRRGGMRFDFTGTDDQAPGSINAPLAVTRSACLYVARCLAGGAQTERRDKSDGREEKHETTDRRHGAPIQAHSKSSVRDTISDSTARLHV